MTLIIFAVSLGLRSVTFILVWMEEWPNFFDVDLQKSEFAMKYELIFVFQYIIFDVIPIGVLAF